MNATPPKAPKTNRNGSMMTKFGLIGLCTVILSGTAGYFAGQVGAENKMDSSMAAISQNGTLASQEELERYVTQGGSVVALDVSDIVATLRPSVVEIMTESYSNGNSIFGQYVSQGAGSGVILSEDGYIVTNNHVVEGASYIQVKTWDGQEYEAKICGTDSQTDIAVIKVEGDGLAAAKIGNSDDIEVGEVAIAIGNPLGSLGGTVTTGIISAVGREITIENETMTLLQTDAAINPGNSGGGLFNIEGQLIGVVNAKQSNTGIEGLGFAIPISDVTSVIEDLVQSGRVTSRPVLNVSLQQISNAYYGFGNSPEPGLYIAQIVEGGTADRAGLQVGDQIIAFDGQNVTTAAEVKKLLRQHHIGDTVSMTIVRDGQEQEVELTLLGSDNNS